MPIRVYVGHPPGVGVCPSSGGTSKETEENKRGKFLDVLTFFFFGVFMKSENWDQREMRRRQVRQRFKVF